MTNYLRRGAVGLLAMTIATPSFADVTPQDVWDQWNSYMTSFGYAVATEPQNAGGNLHWPEFTLSLEIPQNEKSRVKGGTVGITLEGITMSDRGDGTVAIDMPAVSKIMIVGEGTGDDDFAVSSTMTTEGYSMIASGQPGDINYVTDAVRIAMTVDEIDGKNGKMPTPGVLSFIMEGMKAENRITTGDIMQMSQDFSIVNLIYNIDITDPNPDEEGHFKWNGTIGGLSSTGVASIPRNMDMTDLAAAMDAGYAMNGSMKYTTGQGAMDFADDESAFKMSTTSAGVDLTAAMSKAGIAYDVLVNQLRFNMSGNDIPFPISSGMSAFGLGVSMPIQASENDQPFGASITMRDVDLPLEVWGMADPTGALPHDPVTAEIDLTGNGRLFVNLMNEDEMTQLGMTGGVPGELSKVIVNKLLLKAAGATITAAADVDVDNKAKSIFNPAMPAIGGTANLRLTGVTGLIDKLAQMGLIPPGPAMMASGMAKQLGKAESGPDDLSAAIVLTKEGSLTVNGNPMPLQ